MCRHVQACAGMCRLDSRATWPGMARVVLRSLGTLARGPDAPAIELMEIYHLADSVTACVVVFLLHTLTPFRVDRVMCSIAV
jgi:hypothetical protein